ncbi:SRPBCC family protein [Sphingobacterium paludis]|uniref:Ligand-binding SRPBCC domain-containing protein n=1 Tax=Sphingobacterium paludis TaxID=1476465 RepID=A0A4R7DBX6_9SPHI|nr:SRPBCC family protein [Sphingobacterium paludis]TDS17414.1 ligand-binding SRPBCC domain-containing protein [Sphingobacterium paludis]
MIYTLERTQFFTCGLDEAWAFFTNPNNLATITPDTLNFKVLDTFDTPEIYEGMIINYHVTPLLGIRLSWQTRITEVVPRASFIDNQEKGPYTLWQHTHEFFAEDGGVRVKDTVRYAMPFGVLGTLVHKLIVKNKLREIFDYRQQTLEKILNYPAHD